MIHRGEQLSVLHCFARLARRQRQDNHSAWCISGSDRKFFQESERLLAKIGFLHLHSPGVDQIFQNFIEQNQIELIAKKLK